MFATIGVISFFVMIIFLVRAIVAWKKKTGRVKKRLFYAVVFFALYLVMLTINNSIYPAKATVKHITDTKQQVTKEAKQSDVKIKQEEALAKKKADDEAKKKAEEEATAKKKAQQAADAKATQRSELQALGDWDIKSNSDDFSSRYAKIQQYIAQGDTQSAYDEATMASKQADNLNTNTMSHQDMNNVPEDIPSDVRDILNGVDPHLAQGYMLEKQGFDALAVGINNNDVSKISTAKDNFSLANDEFNQAKTLIDKANAMLN